MRMQNEESESPLARALLVFSILHSHSNFLIFRGQTTARFGGYLLPAARPAPSLTPRTNADVASHDFSG